jgi:hypothetical protein
MPDDRRRHLNAVADDAADRARVADQRQAVPTLIDDGDVLASCRPPARLPDEAADRLLDDVLASRTTTSDLTAEARAAVLALFATFSLARTTVTASPVGPLVDLDVSTRLTATEVQRLAAVAEALSALRAWLEAREGTDVLAAHKRMRAAAQRLTATCPAPTGR